MKPADEVLENIFEWIKKSSYKTARARTETFQTGLRASNIIDRDIKGISDSLNDRRRRT